MRKIIIAGNWKMNTTLTEAQTLASELKGLISSEGSTEVILCPPFISLHAVNEIIKDSGIKLGAQTMANKESGAYTGEISAAMLAATGCSHVILGHSERREYYGETNALINQKIKLAFAHNLTPIVCVGETLEQREQNVTFAIIEQQLRESLHDLSAELAAHSIVIAYEPVWAIGTGKVATPEQAQEVHAFIRKILTSLYGASFSENTSVQYGGSVKPDNIAELISKPDIDGALVGGASLQANSFATLIATAKPVAAN